MRYLKSLGLFIGSFLIFNIIITVLNYFELLNINIAKIIKIVIIIISLLSSGIYLGLKSSKKGYLEGLKLGGIIIVILTLLVLIFPIKFNIFSGLYYLIILGLETLGATIGINKKSS